MVSEETIQKILKKQLKEKQDVLKQLIGALKELSKTSKYVEEVNDLRSLLIYALRAHARIIGKWQLAKEQKKITKRFRNSTKHLLDAIEEEEIYLLERFEGVHGSLMRDQDKVLIEWYLEISKRDLKIDEKIF